MFSSQKSTPAIRQDNKPMDTIIGPTAKMTGNIEVDGLIRIDGNYTGDVTSKTQIVIGEGATIQGNLSSKEIIISGQVKGNIYSEGTLEITSKGNLKGDIEVGNLVLAKGAIFKGKCDMKYTDKDVEENSLGKIDEDITN